MKFFVIIFKLFVCAYIINIDAVVTGSIIIYDAKNQTLDELESVSAAFGPRISTQGFKGYIAVANPIGGCSPLDKPPNVSFVGADQWIVLIKRTPTIYGNCSFDLKVHNAQLAGYNAVIIYNSESDNLIKMSSSGKYNIQIPSVFISNSAGLEIGMHYAYLNGTYAVINSDDDNLNYLLIPFICVVAVCFILAVSIFVSKFAFHIYKLQKNRFPKSALKKIPTKKYQKTDKYDTCPICLNEYEEGEKMRILPCEHAYHVECIDKWLLRNNRFCPVCKRRVLPGGSDSESDDGQDSRPTTVQVHLPNEDDDTNESSRLLVNVQSNTNDDNVSAGTNSTILTTNVSTMNEVNSNAMNPNQDLSSMNNQMTVSVTSSQAPPNNNQNKDLRSSSSRYGSIASSLNIITNSATTSKPTDQINDSDSYEAEITTNPTITNPQSRKHSEENIDSKATPEFHSPIEITPNSPRNNNNTQSELPHHQVINVKPMKKKNSIKSAKTKNRHNNNVSEDDSDTIEDDQTVESSDKQTLLKQQAQNNKSRNKKNKKKPSSQHQASSSSAKNKKDDDKEDPSQMV